MDWSKVIVKVPVPNKVRAGELGTLDAAKLLVISKLIKKSLAAIVQTAILTYLSRNWEEHENRLNVEANRLGISPEELFMNLVENKEEL